MEERMVKIGGNEKVEVGIANMKTILKHSAIQRASFLEDSPELLNSRDFTEALRYDTQLMKKIQLKEDRKLKEVEGKEINEVD